MKLSLKVMRGMKLAFELQSITPLPSFSTEKCTFVLSPSSLTSATVQCSRRYNGAVISKKIKNLNATLKRLLKLERGL